LWRKNPSILALLQKRDRLLIIVDELIVGLCKYFELLFVAFAASDRQLLIQQAFYLEVRSLWGKFCIVQNN
jgi:hypothetical protein